MNASTGPKKVGTVKRWPLAEIGGRTSTVGKVLDCKGGRGLNSQDRTESERLKKN